MSRLPIEIHDSDEAAVACRDERCGVPLRSEAFARLAERGGWSHGARPFRHHILDDHVGGLGERLSPEATKHDVLFVDDVPVLYLRSLPFPP